MVMNGGSPTWLNTTHDWAQHVDLDHLVQIRRQPARFAPGGVLHLVLEMVAYAADEAGDSDGGRVVIALLPDGSVSVADNGRGTDTRSDDQGRTVKKPVMATMDLRFFNAPGAVTLPDGQPRRGMSVVAALSRWLVHTNRRRKGSWTQRYQWGVPVAELTEVPDEGTTGTTVHFQPDPALVDAVQASADLIHSLPASFGPHLAVELDIALTVISKRTSPAVPVSVPPAMRGCRPDSRSAYGGGVDLAAEPVPVPAASSFPS